MTLSSKRLIAKLDEIIRESMIAGYVPDPVAVQRILNTYAQGRDLSNPSMLLRSQPRRGQFQIDSFNNMLAEIISDLNFSFAEQVDQANRLIRSINEADTKHTSFMTQINLLADAFEHLLLIEPKANGYFYALGDSFRDLSKVDLENTTAEVDLSSSAAYLPMQAGTRKIAMPHLAERTSIIVTSNQPETVIEHGPVGGSQFGQAFDDTYGGWMYRIVSSSQDGWTGHITIPISMNPPRTDAGGTAQLTQVLETQEIYISRIDIEGLQNCYVEARILYSLDNKNFLILNDWVDITRKQSLFFPRTKVEFIRIEFRAYTPNIVGAYEYVVGLRNISFYDAGFAKECELRSLRLNPELNTPIGALVLDADELIIPGTDIEYYVAPYAVSPVWSQIKPLSRGTQILKFADSVESPRKSNQIAITSTPAVNSTKNGIIFYNIDQLSGDQVNSTAKLFRGIGGWHKTFTTRTEKINVQDNYVVFTTNDNFQALYQEVTELVTPPASGGGIHTTITLDRSILIDDSLNIKPDGSSSSFIPNYSIKQVILLKYSSTGSGTVAVTQNTDGTRRVRLTGLTPTMRVGSSVYVNQDGKFHKITQIGGAFGSTWVHLEDTDRTLVNGSITWVSNSQDVTSYVRSGYNNTFVLDKRVSLLTSDRLLVTYRSPMSDEETPLSDTIIVRDRASGTPYAAGIDYVYNSITKGISRNPDGAIKAGPDGEIAVRVDFTFERELGIFEVYTSWFYYDGDGAKIPLTSINVGDNESIMLSVDDDYEVDLAEVTEISGLAKGWRRLVVVSTFLQSVTGTVLTSSAIYKTINAIDSNSLILFGPAHFAEQRAIIDPASFVSLHYLQSAIGKDDRTSFAVDDSNNVVVNYNPAAKNDVLYLYPGSTTVQTMERFELQYSEEASGGTPITSVLFKAVFKRLDGYTADRTPVLRSYNLRLSH